MKVLIACEESQTVCMAFRERGHGRWKPVFDAEAFRGDPEAAMADEITGYECSICGRTCAFTDGNGEYILPDVCPGCRAKMDGDEENAAD